VFFNTTTSSPALRDQQHLVHRIGFDRSSPVVDVHAEKVDASRRTRDEYRRITAEMLCEVV